MTVFLSDKGLQRLILIRWKLGSTGLHYETAAALEIPGQDFCPFLMKYEWKTWLPLASIHRKKATVAAGSELKQLY